MRRVLNGMEPHGFQYTHSRKHGSGGKTPRANIVCQEGKHHIANKLCTHVFEDTFRAHLQGVICEQSSTTRAGWTFDTFWGVW